MMHNEALSMFATHHVMLSRYIYIYLPAIGIRQYLKTFYTRILEQREMHWKHFFIKLTMRYVRQKVIYVHYNTPWCAFPISHFIWRPNLRKRIYRILNKYFPILILISNIINVLSQTLCIIKGLMTEIDCNIVNVIL